VSSTTTATTQAPAAQPAAGQGTTSVTTGSVRGTLRGENLDIEFAFGGQVVGRDTPPTHPVTDGHWRDSLKFSADAVGMPLSLQAVVHTRLGSITLAWPIRVRQ
jgi:hypothetical protein